jgi:hypothetical protein
MKLQRPAQSLDLDLRRFTAGTQFYWHCAVAQPLRSGCAAFAQWVSSHCAVGVQPLLSGCASLRSSVQPLCSGCAAITQWCTAIAQRVRTTTGLLRSRCAAIVQWVRSHYVVDAQPLRSFITQRYAVGAQPLRSETLLRNGCVMVHYAVITHRATC